MRVIKFKVVKKDGSIVDFKKSKILNSIIAAGGDKEMANLIVDSIVEDLHLIKSGKIGQMVKEKIQNMNKKVADNWIKHSIQAVNKNPIISQEMRR